MRLRTIGQKVEELYDLEADLGERTNLAAKFPEKVSELKVADAVDRRTRQAELRQTTYANDDLDSDNNQKNEQPDHVRSIHFRIAKWEKALATGYVMNQSAVSVASRIGRWASRQLADYDAHTPGTLFTEGVVLSVAKGYELQTAVAQLRRERGERIIGYKVGCTSPKIRTQLGIDHCVTGRLYDQEQHSSGSVLSRGKYANLAIEGELAVELSREPCEKDFFKIEIPACVARVFPVIELHNHVMRGKQPSAGELIAHNALHAGFVAGCGHSSDESVVEALRSSSAIAIFADERLLDECVGFALIQTIHSSLKWLMEWCVHCGERLSAGQIVLTGSIPSLIPIGEDCRIRVDAPPFGSVEVQLIP